MKKILTLFTVILSATNNIFSQDTTRTLNIEQLLNIVKANHPVAKIANINVEKAKANRAISYSAFEPVIGYYLSEKTFDGVNYYQYTSPQIRIPAWFGAEVYAGFENLSGRRIDESQTTGNTSYAGLSVPVLKTFWFDKRRADLQLAQVFVKMSEAEQRSTLNDILYQASSSYWNWVRAYQVHTIIKQNVEVNEIRLALIVKSYENGERAAIDTTEARTQLLSFELLEKQKWYEFQEATLELSSYLWTENNSPYQLPYTIKPQSGWENEANVQALSLDLENLIDIANREHPYLQNLMLKNNQLKIERKLKFQELLPKADVQFNTLSKGYSLLQNTSEAIVLQNNYQIGLKLEMPLLFFKGRGEYKIAKLKLQENNFFIDQKANQIHLKIKDYFNEYQNLKKQIALQSENYNNYNRLLEAEKTKLSNGESSLFLVNSRENKALEAYEKLVEIKTKYFKSIYALQWATGVIR